MTTTIAPLAEPGQRRKPSPRPRRSRPACTTQDTVCEPSPTTPAPRAPWTFTAEEIRPALPWIAAIAGPTTLMGVAVVAGGVYFDAVLDAPIVYGLAFAAALIAFGATFTALLLLRWLQVQQAIAGHTD